MEVKITIKCLVDGEEQELNFGIEDGKLVQIVPMVEPTDEVEPEQPTEEKENVPVPASVIVRDSMPIQEQVNTIFSAKPNVLHYFEKPIDSLGVTLEKPEDEGKVEEYIFFFTTSSNFVFNKFETEDGKRVLYPVDFVLNNSTTYVLSVMYVGGCYVVNENPYL